MAMPLVFSCRQRKHASLVQPTRGLGRSASRLGGKEAEHMLLAHLPYFWNSQSLLSRGQTCLAFSHREMQWKWKACCSYVSEHTVRGMSEQKSWGLHCKSPTRPYTPRSLLMLGSPGTQYLGHISILETKSSRAVVFP